MRNQVTNAIVSRAMLLLIPGVLLLSSLALGAEEGGSPQMNAPKGWIVLRFAEQSASGMVGILFPGTNRQPTVDLILTNGSILKSENEYADALGKIRDSGETLSFPGADEFPTRGYNQKLFMPYTPEQIVRLNAWLAKGATVDKPPTGAR
jgi:hypothetical protein